jgi:hypothetical protein
MPTPPIALLLLIYSRKNPQKILVGKKYRESVTASHSLTVQLQVALFTARNEKQR